MAQQATDPERLLTEIQAADLLRLSSRTLQAWRSQGVGPEYVKAGRAVRYRRPALIAWTEENTVVAAPLVPAVVKQAHAVAEVPK
ncbi:MAG TPA: helix-turn-helix domain-containing protein [Pseudolabrys sp.]|uniref:helix-turn-helix transcriptional regulator n=1 Tax=Pseudolabrys sp. TaxID=1960880 RepID=UPI002DDCBBE0|nr:helix-turn-helix domain-containing protein [Pseudolabrys sp.]HEV2630826.1 helix-turn-helix domain-containing protein [Pseudolabrys sp.]